ncbi:MAG: hypothetical protein RIE08_14320 [Acidimicrobiales bacterium]
MKKIIAIVAATVMALGLLAVAPASAQTDGDYVTDSTITVDDSTPGAGDPVTITVTGCEAGATLVATIDGSEVGTATADSDGTGEIVFNVPAGIEGDATVLVTGCGDVLAVVLSVQVAPDLAFTGSDSLPTALIAVVLIAFGAVLALGARRYQLAAVNRNE